MRITKSIQKLEYNFDIKAEKFMFQHPLIGFFSLFIGMPVFVLACVCASTAAIIFPMAWVMGWL